MFPDFWKNKRVLITGHTGFKGGWLALWLQSLRARVTGYALPPPSNPSLFEIAHVADGMVSMTGDVRDLGRLKSCLSDCQPEIVIHMAAQSLVRYSYDNPLETFATNVMGTANLLEVARHADSVKVVIVVTSDKCYENKEWLWGYRENEPMGGYDPYSSSKGCAELVTAAYRNSFFKKAEGSGIAVASVRAGNVIGGGDWAKDRLIPDVMQAFLESRPALVRHPAAVRPWQHVLEPLRGYLVLAERMWQDRAGFSEAWNFGPDECDARPVSWIVEQLAAQWGHGASWNVDSPPQPHEAAYLKLDCSKARARLGWSLALPLEPALKWVVEWYQAYRHSEDMRHITENQICRYQSQATT